jgi:hypothetical protein
MHAEAADGHAIIGDSKHITVIRGSAKFFADAGVLLFFPRGEEPALFLCFQRVGTLKTRSARVPWNIF